jgi:hypothetical protein
MLTPQSVYIARSGKKNVYQVDLHRILYRQMGGCENVNLHPESWGYGCLISLVRCRLGQVGIVKEAVVRRWQLSHAAVEG